MKKENKMQKKILIVDDDKALLEAMAFMLLQEGYVVLTHTGKAILKEVRATMPDLILLDVLLSGKDGRNVSLKIKQEKPIKDIPVILLSAHPSAGETYRKYLADEFLAKPFDNEQLLTLIKKHLR